MRRRTLLATVAGVGTTVSAGCVGRFSGGDDAGGGDVDDGKTDTDGTDTGDANEDGTGGNTIDDVGCPSFVEDADRTICYREADRSSAPVYLEPSAPTYEDHTDDGTVQTIRFDLHNRSDREFAYNPHNWAVYGYRDGAWTRVAPDEWIQPLAFLPPGETASWSLATEPHPSPDDEVVQVTATLDSGHTHAFRVVGNLGDDEDAPRLECVAVFDYVRSAP